MTRKDKQAAKRRATEATRLDNFEDFGAFDEIAKLANIDNSAGGDAEASGFDKVDKNSVLALQKAVQALSKSGTKAGKRSMAEDNDSDADDYYAQMMAAAANGGDDNTSSRKRRKAPEMSEFAPGGGSDDDDDDAAALLADYSNKKKQFQSTKQAQYAAEPRYGGFEESVGDGDKRAASYEIVKNKGLTPHRKKANRNPRVKKREKYAKAVVARKGQVRDVISGAAGAYGGEMTGIKANIARSRKIDN